MKITRTRRIVAKAAAGQLQNIETDAGGRYVVVDRYRGNTGITAVVCDAKTGEPIISDLVRAGITPDGKRVYASTKKDAFAMALPKGKREAFPRDVHWVSVVGNQFVWTSNGDDIVILDGVTRKKLGKVPSPPRRANVPGAHRPSFSAEVPLPDGKTLAFLDARFNVHLIDLGAAKVTATIKGGPRELPESFIVSRDGTRALARGSKGVCVLFDLVKAKVVCTRPKIFGRHSAWLDDGRLVLGTAAFELHDLVRGKKKAFGKRDASREFIEAMLPLYGPHVLVLFHRAKKNEPWNVDRPLEVWDVDRGKCVASCSATSVNGAIRVVNETTVLASEQTPKNELETVVRVYSLKA